MVDTAALTNVSGAVPQDLVHINCHLGEQVWSPERFGSVTAETWGRWLHTIRTSQAATSEGQTDTRGC